MGRLGCYLIIALLVGTFYGLVRGSSELYTAVTNGSPTEMTVAEYIADRPSAKWLKLTNADVSLLQASYSSKRGTIEELFIPVFPADSDSETPVVLLQSKRPAWINLATKMSNLKSDGDVLMFAVKNREVMDLGKEVMGLRGQFGDVEDRTRDQLKKLNPKIGNDFVIILDGVKPSYGRALGMLALGIGCLVVLVILALAQGGGSEETTGGAGATTSGAPPPLPGQGG